MISKGDIQKIEELKSVAESVIPKGGQVWLFGSRARGEARSSSDWDLLILLPQSKITSADEDNFAYPFVLAGWKHDLDVNPQIYTFEEWAKRSFTPFYKNVEHDKVSIYES